MIVPIQDPNTSRGGPVRNTSSNSVSFSIASELVGSIGQRPAHRPALVSSFPPVQTPTQAPPQIALSSSPRFANGCDGSSQRFANGCDGNQSPRELDFLASFETLHSKFLGEVLRLYRESLAAESGSTFVARDVNTIVQPKTIHDEEPLPSVVIGMEQLDVEETDTHQAPKCIAAAGEEKPKDTVATLRQKSITSVVRKDHLPKLISQLHGNDFFTTPLEKFAVGRPHQALMVLAVTIQAASMGAIIQMEIKYEGHRLMGEPTTEVPVWLGVLNGILTAFFIVELIFRCCVLQGRFFMASNMDDRCWNWFDVVVVAASVPDFFPESALKHLSVLRVVRLLRIVRLLKVAYSLAALRKMIFALTHSMSSLAPLIVLLCLLLYMFALVFMQGAVTDMRDMEYIPDNTTRLLKAKAGLSDAQVTRVYYNFRDIPNAMESLFTMVTGDGDWKLIMNPIMESSGFYKFWGLFFSVFFVFGFMNVATGLFVDKAMQISRADRETVIKEAIQREEDDIAALKQLFQTADLDGDGTLTVPEMRAVVAHRDVKNWLSTIDLDITEDFEAVIQVLDPQNNGYVQAEDFYAIISRFRGPARRLETTLCLFEARVAAAENHRLLKRLHELHDLHRAGKVGNVFSPSVATSKPRN